MFLRPSVHKTSNFCIDALLGLSQPCSRCFLFFVSALLPSFSSLPHIFSFNPFFFSLLPVVPSVFCSRCFLLFVSALLPSFSSLPHIFSSNPFFFSLLPVVPSVFCSRCFLFFVSALLPSFSSLLSNPFLPSCLSGFGCGARHHRGARRHRGQGTIAGKCASQRFSASCAAQPKGCSAC